MDRLVIAADLPAEQVAPFSAAELVLAIPATAEDNLRFNTIWNLNCDTLDLPEAVAAKLADPEVSEADKAEGLRWLAQMVGHMRPEVAWASAFLARTVAIAEGVTIAKGETLQ